MPVDISTLTNSTDFLTPYQVKKIIFDYKTTTKPPTYPSGVSVSLSKASATEGETVYATATISPVGYDAKRVKSITWSASGNVNINPQNGIITARSQGTAVITCTVVYKPVSMDDNETRTVTGTAILNVIPATIYADYIVATLDRYTCTQGDTAQATAVVYPTNASNRSVTWRSSSPSIAGIDALTGKITTYAAGSVYFIATAADGSGRTANTNNLTVAAKETKVSNIVVSVTPSTITAGGTAQASATIYPTNADNKSVAWSISPTTGASITQSGAISTTAQGNYTVTATAQDGSNKTGTATLGVEDVDYDLRMSLVYGDSFTVKNAVGDNTLSLLKEGRGRLVVSVDGSWASYPSVSFDAVWANGAHDIAYHDTAGGSLVIMWGGDRNNRFTFASINNDYGTPSTQFYNSLGVAFGLGLYVIVGKNGLLAYTTDNRESSATKLQVTATTLNSVAYGNGVFIAVGDAGTILKSTNGKSWTYVNSDMALGAKLTKVIFANSKWVIIGSARTLLVSSDGNTFTRATPAISREITDVAGGAGRFVITHAAQTNKSCNTFSTSDFTDYKQVGYSSSNPVYGGRLVAFAGGYFYISITDTSGSLPLEYVYKLLWK